MQIEIDTLDKIEIETKRFLVKLNAARDRIKKESWAAYGCNETGAVRRAALDLKSELTRITR